MPMQPVSVQDPEIEAAVHGNERPSGVANGVVCAFIVAICLGVAYPKAEMGFIDDWSYVKTAQVFAETGHLVYNGWGALMLGWQIVWGALFIKLAGFSFAALRLSTISIAMVTVALYHSILLRFKVNERNAVLGTLTLGLSPLFMPFAASYMSDVYGLFAIVLCLYLCQRAVGASSSKASIVWMSLAACSSVIGGTGRQIAWLGALVVVPSTGWLLRKRRGVQFASLLLLVGSVVSVAVCMRWFARQPHIISEAHMLKSFAFSKVLALRFFFTVSGAALCLLLVSYPVLAAWLSALRKLSAAALTRISCIALIYALIQMYLKWTMPWIKDTIVSEFGIAKTWPNPSAPGLPLWLRETLSLLVIATALVLFEQFWSAVRMRARHRSTLSASWREMLWLLGPFCLFYLLFLFPRAYHFEVLDRYLLPLMPPTIALLLRLYQQWNGSVLPAGSILALAAYSLLAIGGTHDWFARHRAQLTAINEVRAAGVPRAEILGGFEYDGWTQLEESGYTDDPHLEIFSSRVAPSLPHDRKDWKECELEYSESMFALHPKYTTAFQKMWCLAPSKFPPVRYRTWLPPHERMIYVQEIPAKERLKTLKPGS